MPRNLLTFLSYSKKNVHRFGTNNLSRCVTTKQSVVASEKEEFTSRLSSSVNYFSTLTKSRICLEDDSSDNVKLSKEADDTNHISKVQENKLKTRQEQQSTNGDDNFVSKNNRKSQRVWLSSSSTRQSPSNKKQPTKQPVHFWDHSVDSPFFNKEVNNDSGSESRDTMKDVIESIYEQELEGGRMQTRQLGVIREDPSEDIRLLMQNYTVPSLATALRGREDVLQYCATLLQENRIDELKTTLKPFEPQYVLLRRQQKNHLRFKEPSTSGGGFDTASLEMLRKGLMRMPRQVTQAHNKRASVVLPLCNVGGIPCILFEKRAGHLRAHPDEVCLPGGMVSENDDPSIVSTSLREMEEEIVGIHRDNVSVLGILRCNWGEVAQITGIAVTPVVCFIGDLDEMNLHPNPDEVAECFTVPLSSFLEHDRWIHKENCAPIFTGGPHVIWGLTGYIVNRFVKDVLARYTITFSSEIKSDNLSDKRTPPSSQ